VAIGRLTVVSVLAMSLVACDAEVPTEPTGTSAPRITGVTPSTPIAGVNPQQLEIRGERFLTGLSLVMATPDGATLTIPPAEISSLESSSFVTTVVLTQPGTYSLTVRNATAETSPPFILTVVADPGQTQPVITGIVPSNLTRGVSPQTVLVQGANFAAGLSVTVTDPDGLVNIQTGSAIDSLTPSSFQLTMVFGKVGTYSLRVVNPSGDGSNVVNLVAGQ
jgi:hypothetical protein